MTLSTGTIYRVAKTLDDAFLEKKEIRRITKEFTDLSNQDAYKIQAELVRMRVTRGERSLGFKMGLTSKAKMEQMHVSHPIYGILTDKMQIADTLQLADYIHPKAEPEVAFLLGNDLEGEISIDKVLEACSGVCVAMEIIDSRFHNFEFELPDVIADNCSASAFVLGSTIVHPSDLDLENLKVSLEVNGRKIEEGLTSAILGHPANSVIELSKMLHERGWKISAGSIILAGSATKAIALSADMKVRAIIENIGDVSLEIH